MFVRHEQNAITPAHYCVCHHTKRAQEKSIKYIADKIEVEISHPLCPNHAWKRNYLLKDCVGVLTMVTSDPNDTCSDPVLLALRALLLDAEICAVDHTERYSIGF